MLQQIMYYRQNNNVKNVSFGVGFNPDLLKSPETALKGIDVFSGLSIRDIEKITHNLDAILLQRGCPHQCSHCGANSESKITTMAWENFEDLCEGISEFSKRLGFNPFKMSSSDIDPFSDSEPMVLRMEDQQKQVHNTFDALKLFYERTKVKFFITTAGWGRSNKVSQQAAENIAEHPEYLSGLSVSVHPFDGDIQRGLRYEREEDFDNADKFFERYIDNMANVLNTFKKIRTDIVFCLQYLETPVGIKVPRGLSYFDSLGLLAEIVKRIGAQREKLKIVRRPISGIGRAKQYDRYNRYDSSQDRNDWTKHSTMIAPDGKILIKNSKEGSMGSGTVAQTQYALNFKYPTQNKSQRTMPVRNL